ncbi:MAG: LPS-assembly protein LptD [Bacteroidales bacterium]|nr:LPS-assembly protein LptD [Bacteroidales bacterium]
MYLKFRYFVFLFVLIVIITFKSFAQNNDKGQDLDLQNNNLSENTDISSSNDTVTVTSKSEKAIDVKVIYSAIDSIVLSNDSKKVFLYNTAKIEYGEIVLEADYIEYDQENNFVFATGVEDTLGNLFGKPKFTDNGTDYLARTIKYNFKTKKGYIEDVFTKEEQGFLHSEQTKKLEDNSLLLKNGKYTTCENEEHPHFYLKMSKAKIVPNDKIISGFSYLVMGDIPMPIGVPFGFFPSQTTYSSGVMIPKYGEETKRGFFLQDGGYYFGINDKMDLTITGDIFSKGSWGTQVGFRFKKRYKFNSNLNFSYGEFVQDEGLSNESRSKNMKIRWTHTQDAKANPNSKFSASVDYSTSSYEDFNSKSLEERATNTKQSSITYAKNWPGSPFHLNMNLKHSQNSKTDMVTLNLPVITFNMDRKNPFRRKKATGDMKWYEDIEIQYNSKLENRITTVDSLLFTETTFSDFENGFQHSVPLSTNIKVLKYFNLSPRLVYTGNLYPDKIKYSTFENIDSNGDTTYILDKDTVSTIAYAHIIEPSISLSVGPNIYGMYQFKNPNSNLIAIRHVVTPSASISYRPDLGNFVDQYFYTDSLSSREYSIFDNGIYRFPAAPGESGTINFGLSNNLEMKVRDSKDSTGTGTKKIKLLESFKITTSYNIFADSLNWSQISISGRTSMFKNKLSFNFGATVDPYALNDNGKVYNEFQWNSKEGGIGRLERIDLTVDVKLNSKKGDEEVKGDVEQNNPIIDDRFNNDAYRNTQNQIVTYVDFDIPWNLSATYKFNYSKIGFEESKRITQTLSLTGDVSLTKKWKISFRANYDMVLNELASTSINIHRELHCWEATFSWIPVGYMQSYNFQINVKGSTLKDFLKYDKRDRWQDNL